MKEWIIDQLHIHPARLNQTGIIYHFSLKSLPMMIVQKITPRTRTPQSLRNATHYVNLGINLGFNFEVLE